MIQPRMCRERSPSQSVDCANRRRRRARSHSHRYPTDSAKSTNSYSLSLSFCLSVCQFGFVCRGVRWPLNHRHTHSTQLPCLLSYPRSSSARNRLAASDASFPESLITLQRSRIPLAHDFWHSLLNIVVVQKL